MTAQNLIQQQWVENKIKEIRTYSGITESFTMDSALIRDLHIDSLEMLELIAAIEQYTKVPIQDEIWMKWYNLQDIVEYLLCVK
ncbi:acyl carrier protein [Providencia hangzhouensis]|uniref:Acyl carrier protein n=1 Tax=Providencia rettgeri TaxID=587 RepID=A0AAE2ZD01_PRORE|nr:MULTISPECIES: acyl carrier protein [Providencia]MRF65503.1 acyl carrier protein [Escherichia coli]MBW3114850.1 acyl carrier protein [Providencia rettgeri]MCK9789353.1 acyl carrier protein [Providencia rettgeri]MDX7424037.1 acyl carrier protein [Providencia sp. CIM-Carb-044]NHN50202.1 acyl carrier protein [Providencia rettgeri]